jgi:uncharacterized repeat protein (TIGR03803 family)
MKHSKLRFMLRVALACAAITFSLAVCAQAQILHTIARFDGTNGYGPFSSVVQGIDGNIYGATDSGGNVNTQSGTLFRVTPMGKLTDLYNFCSKPRCTDGSSPATPPVVGTDGNLYGTAGGGILNQGVVYKMTLSGEYSVLYSFCPTHPCTDGVGPGGIILGADGNFYGAAGGGNASNGGAIFSLSPAGQLTVLHTFCSVAPNCQDGTGPNTPILGTDGNFYGVTWAGGSLGGGVLYELSSTGAYTVLYNFCSYLEGCSAPGEPYDVVRDANGNFFGTTEYSAIGSPYGSVFEITSSNQLLVLHDFDDYNDWPYEGVMLGSDGNVYGVFGYDTKASGSIYKVTPEGGYSRIYTFKPEDKSIGAPPVGPLFQGTDGDFYGVRTYGPGNYDGEVFKFSYGLGPLVETVPVAGAVGQSVLILGNGLNRSTSVTFNGVEAAFTVESDTYIKATVPEGATTGVVSVVTPSGTLNSYPQFAVTK